MEEKRKEIIVYLELCNEENVFMALNGIFAQKGFDNIKIKARLYNNEDDTERLLKKYASDNKNLEVVDVNNNYPILYTVRAEDVIKWPDDKYLFRIINGVENGIKD